MFNRSAALVFSDLAHQQRFFRSRHRLNDKMNIQWSSKMAHYA